MKRTIIVHGWDDSPREPMHLWLKERLEEKGFNVTALEMPNPEEPKIETWVPFLKENVKSPDEDTFFIGHSIGCQTILRYLQTLPENIKVGGVLLIAPWLHLHKEIIEEEGQEVVELAKPWLETPIDWKKVKTHADKFTALFSDDDHYVPVSDEVIFKEKLGAKTIMEHGKKHYDTKSGITDNPTALKEILEMIN